MITDLSSLFLMHKQTILSWKKDGISLTQTDFLRLAEENHAFNFQLWNAEDRARRDDQGYEFVYRAKREIDGFNQQRNNRMEAMDEYLFHAWQPSTHEHCPIHSETPGMIIDRLSILALKSFHMHLQTERPDASCEHKQQCLRKLGTLVAQEQQLQKCLNLLMEEIITKKRTFKLYHQFKMYNDPNLNPELYMHNTAQ